MSATRKFLCRLFLFVCCCAGLSVKAAPYASGITNSAGTIRWILNETATDVQILFDNGAATNDLGATPTIGTNSFSLDAHTNFAIVVTKSGLGSLTQISSDANTNNGFYGPRGVAVNNNPASWNFGRIYVANANSGSPSDGGYSSRNVATARGLYVLDAASDDIFARGNTGTLAGMSLGTSTTYAPYKLFVGPDDNLYVGDASTGNIDGIWTVNANGTSSTNVFSRATPTTISTNYGQVIGTPCVTGSLAGGNLNLQTIMWNTIAGASGAGSNQVYRYSIAGGPFPWKSSPIIITNPLAIAANNNGIEDSYTAPDGKIFICAARTSTSDGSTNICVLNTNGGLLWNSKTASAAYFGDSTDHFGPNDYGIAVSPDDKYMAVIQSTNVFLVVGLTNGVPDISTLVTNNTVGIGGGGTARGIAFDAADNIYTVSGGSDVLRIYSLGLSTVAKTANDATATNGTFQFQILVGSGPPSITVQPTNQTVQCGGSVALSIQATGAAPLKYQWYYSGGALSGATASTLLLTNLTTESGGSYSVIVTNTFDSTTSQVAFVAVTDTTPPVLTLLGYSSMAIAEGSSFTDPGTTAIDACAGAVTPTVSGSVDTGVPGVYTLTYTATDPSGNGTTATRVVSVGAASISLAPVWSQDPGSPTDSVRSDDIYFLDENLGYASRNNKIYKTLDGGNTWTLKATINGAHFRSISFLTPTHGFIGNLGPGSYDGGVTSTNVLYETTDGGSTWNSVPGIAEQGMKGFCAMYVLDSNHIYGGGRVRAPAFFVKSENAGTNWTVVNLTAAGVMNGIMDVYFQDTTNGWLCGMDTNAFNSCVAPYYHGAIARTTDGGQTWTQVVNSGLNCSYFWKMAWPSKQVGYCSLQQNGIYDHVVYYKTVDGGNTWTSNSIPPSMFDNAGNFYIQAIGFVSTNVGWVGGASGFANADTFLGTTDGGLTWKPAGYNLTTFINRIRFKSSDYGVASGYRLHHYRSPLSITNQSASQALMGGDSALLQVGVFTLATPGYQWQKNGVSIPGATTAVLPLSNVSRTNEGLYTVIVTNSYGQVVSSNIAVRVYIPQQFGRPQLLGNGTWRFVFGNADGSPLGSNNLANFELDATSDLTNWQQLSLPFYLTNGMIQVDDSTNYQQRFYRVIEH